MVGDGVNDAVALDTLLVADIEALPCAKRVSPLGPPQISDELPEQVIVQRPSVAGTLPVDREFPQ
jgi:hypothetical protein